MSATSLATTALGLRATAQQQAQQLMAQNEGRPNVRTGTPQAKGQMGAALGASGWSALGHLSKGVGVGAALGKGMMSPVGMGLMFANPKARVAQVAADRVYLGTSKYAPYISARTADVTKGGLKDVNIRKVSAQVGLTEKVSSATVPLSFGAQVRQGLARKLPALAVGAAALPLGVAAVAGLDRANRIASRAMNHAAESGRFDRAMQGFDPAQMGDPSFQYRYEQDPQGMNAALRESFGVLNRIAPSVAKDPTLAREYMKRLTLDPEYRQPPEEYLRQVQGAVQLENALQSAAPSLLEFGTAPAALLKGV